MIQNLIAETGIWTWWILAAILIGIEVLAPGTFFLWFGLSAIVVGAITMLFGLDSTVWVWQIQLIAFVLFALLFAVLGRSLMQKRGWNKSEQPDLNDRGGQLVGRYAILTQPINQGMGRAQIGDTTWRVEGPDLPEGAKVVVISANAGTLKVDAIQSES